MCENYSVDNSSDEESNASVSIFESEQTLKFTLSPSHLNDEVLDTPIFRLPVQLLIDIFKLLPSFDRMHNVPAVCQLWYKVSLNPTIRTRLVLGRQIPSDLLVNAITTRPLLRLLHCPALEQGDLILPKLIKLCTLLECLDVGFCSLSEQAVDNLAHNLPSTLLHLNVEGISTIEINFITTLVSRCPKLEALNLSHCVSVNDSCVKAIAEGLPHLRRLNLDGGLWLSDVGLLYLATSESMCKGRLNAIWLDGFELSNAGFTEFLNCLISRGKRFCKSISVQNHHHCKIGTNLNPEIGIHLLSVSFCDHLEDESVSLLANLPGLISLTLRKANQVSSQGLSSLFGFSASSDLIFKPCLQWLEHLDLSEAPGVTDSVVADMCKCCGRRLRTLTLNWCWELTDKSVDLIIDVCITLRQLSLVGNSVIKGNAFAKIPLNQPFLIILNLTQCNHVQDNILKDLASTMPNLYIFDFFGERVGGEMNDICHFDLSRALAKIPICSHSCTNLLH